MRPLQGQGANNRGALALITVGAVTAVLALTLTLGSAPAGGPSTAIDAGAGIAASPVDDRSPAPAAPRKLVVDDQPQPDGDRATTSPESSDAADAAARSADSSGVPISAEPEPGASPDGGQPPATDSNSPSTSATTATAAPTTTRPSTTARQSTTATTSRPTTAAPAPSGRFKTLPPGSALPTGAECAARVRPTPENVPENRSYNQRRGHSVAGKTQLSQNPSVEPNTLDSRIDGNFVGSTDEIIQWGACKWGFDEDHIRAQAYAESTWFAGQLGDCGHRTQARTNGCASVGLLQVRAAALPTPAHIGVWPIAWESTALNVDYTLGARRLCYEGLETWLGDVDNHGVSYRAGDEWGCIGRWFSGSWHDYGAKQYVERVKERLRQRQWETRFVGCPAWDRNHYCSDGGPRGF